MRSYLFLCFVSRGIASMLLCIAYPSCCYRGIAWAILLLSCFASLSSLLQRFGYLKHLRVSNREKSQMKAMSEVSLPSGRIHSLSRRMQQRKVSINVREGSLLPPSESPVYTPRKRRSSWRQIVSILSVVVSAVLLIAFVKSYVHISVKSSASEPFQAFRPVQYKAPPMTDRKAAFLEKYPRYGYNGRIDEIVGTQLSNWHGLVAPSFARTHYQSIGDVYLDWTGSGIYQRRQIELVMKDLTSNLYGNTHSVNPSSSRTDRAVAAMRKKILQWFNVTSAEYAVIFTSGATGGLKMVVCRKSHAACHTFISAPNPTPGPMSCASALASWGPAGRDVPLER